ncbi:hypothetical protein Tco_0786965 [Tanacetum coccineum]
MVCTPNENKVDFRISLDESGDEDYTVFTMKMEILLEPTSNKLMVEHAEYDESNTYVLERFNTTAGNPVKKILLKLNLSDHRLFKDGGGDAQDHNVKYKAQRTSSIEKSMITTTYSQENVKKDELKTKDKA